MSYPIEYSPIAIRDFDRIWAEVYEASKEKAVATRYIDGLMDSIAFGRSDYMRTLFKHSEH